jgi:hypothetical protein
VARGKRVGELATDEPREDVAALRPWCPRRVRSSIEPPAMSRITRSDTTAGSHR